MKQRMKQALQVLFYSAGLFCLVHSPALAASVEQYFYAPDVNDINYPLLQYSFTFNDLPAPAATLTGDPPRIEETGTLFLQHVDGQFGLERESVGVFIDNLYFGPAFIESNSNTDLEAIVLDWHQLNSIVSDGTAVVTIVNSLYVGEGVMTEYGIMSGWLVYDVNVDVSTPVYIDINPGKCPNKINVKSGGKLSVAILGTEEFDVSQVDPTSIELEGVPPISWSMKDVATPYAGDMEDCDPNDCHALEGDGYMDLVLKFKVPLLVPNLDPGDCDILELTGYLYDSTPIAGSDVVAIKNPGSGE